MILAFSHSEDSGADPKKVKSVAAKYRFGYIGRFSDQDKWQIESDIFCS